MSNQIIEPITYWGKQLWGRALSKHDPNLGKPIYIFSTRRSGSTLLMRMIYSQPNVSFIDQPLSPWRYAPCQEQLSTLHSMGRFIDLDPEEEQVLRDLFSDIYRGKQRLHSQWNPLDPAFSFRVNRLVLKMLNAKPLMDWFTCTLDAEIVYLVRHPIPVAMSILNRSWECTAKAFLTHAGFRERFLTENQVVKAQDVLENGSLLEHYVLEWCLENTYPLHVFGERSWLTLTYEELIMRPQRVSKLICRTFTLPDPERMVAQVSKPTKTTVGHSRKDIRREDGRHLVTRWYVTLAKDEIERAAEVIDLFCPVEVYDATSPYPMDRLCHFGPLRETDHEQTL